MGNTIIWELNQLWRDSNSTIFYFAAKKPCQLQIHHIIMFYYWHSFTLVQE